MQAHMESHAKYFKNTWEMYVRISKKKIFKVKFRCFFHEVGPLAAIGVLTLTLW